MKCLIEVEFVGPDAEKGPEAIVRASREMAGNAGIKVPGIDCRCIGYRLVEKSDIDLYPIFFGMIVGAMLLAALSSFI